MNRLRFTAAFPSTAFCALATCSSGRAMICGPGRHDIGMNARESETARAALIALALGVINSDDSSPPVSTFFDDLRQQMNEWINIKLHEGPIRVSELAAAHNVSPRTVHRAFATGGDTMTSVVRVRRLNAVRQDVIGTRMTMTAIAHRWGYYDPSHLAREFRRQFGLSPADYRSVYGY
jgi:AraC family transcriptional activator of tynA and feaB